MLETNVIPIEYDDKTKLEADKLKGIIDNNQLLFQIFLAGNKKISFTDTDEEDVIEISSIEDFQNLLSEFIPTYMEMLKKNVYTQGGEDIDAILLKMMLLDVIASKENNELDENTIIDIRLNINAIYSIVGFSYYQDQNTPEKIIDFIFNPSSVEKEKIFAWLNQRERYNLLNSLLEEEYQKLLELESLEEDTYLRKHLSELLELSEIDIIDRLKKDKEKNPNLPKLTKNELDKLCIEFFIKIDPSLKWLKLYNEIKNKNSILYGQKFPDPISDWGCLQLTDNIYIYAPLDGTIRDFMYFIHEFAHCVTLTYMQKGQFISSGVKEFPPIFFERLATAFLKEKGYDEKLVKDLEEERTNSTLGNMSDVSPSLRYLTQYLEKGSITYQTEKEKMDRIRGYIPEDLPEEMKQLINDLMSTEDEENVHIKIDAENSFLIEHPNCIFEESPYIIGYNLAEKTLEKEKTDPMLIYTMLDITENLGSETVESIMKKLNMTTEDISKKSLPYVKKRTTNQN